MDHDQGRSVLIIEDDHETCDGIRTVLSPKFRVLTAENGARGIKLAQREKPDLILLGLGMSDPDSLTICRTLRMLELTCKIPIIMLTAPEDEDDLRAVAILGGGDDLISKPVRPKELIARIQMRLKAAQVPNESPLLGKGTMTCGNLWMNLDRLEAKVGGEEMKLTLLEFQLLAFLVLNQTKILPRKLILKELWGDRGVTARVVDNHIMALRKKLKLAHFDHEIVSMYRAGYGLKSKGKERA